MEVKHEHMKLCELQMPLNLHDFDSCQIQVKTFPCDFEFDLLL